MESDEAKLIREGAEATYKMRRRTKPQARQKLAIQETSGDQNLHSRPMDTQGTSVRDIEIVSAQGGQCKGPLSTREQDRLAIVANIIRQSLVQSTVLTGTNYAISPHIAPGSDMRLLMTFLDVIIPLQYGPYQLSPKTDRRWLAHVLIETEPFYQASASVASSFEHRLRNGNLYGVSDLDPEVRLLQTKALRGLQQLINDLGSENYHGKDLLRRGMQALAIMTELVALDVFNFTAGQWEMHLQASRTILGMFQKKWVPDLFTTQECVPGVSAFGSARAYGCSVEDLKALKFFITSFIWVDIIANATHGPPRIDPKHFEYLALLKSGLFRPQEVMVCQSCIMIAMTEVTALERWKNEQLEQGCLSMAQLVSQATALNDALVRGIQGLERILGGVSKRSDTDSEAVNLVFAYAALVYLHTVVSGASTQTAEIKHNVTRCLESIEALPAHLIIRICWPMTIAGCMATEDQYDRFREVVPRTIDAKQNLGTTWKGMKAMEECWRLRRVEGGLWCCRTAMERMGMKILLI
jgi:C6 transcription factor Pro1